MTRSSDSTVHDGCDSGALGVLPVDPFRSLRVQFGMLLGVDDFETLGAYGRGKMWLHSAWLHREGVVWGFGVTTDLTRGELKVGPGLALDGLGRELHHDVAACLSIPAWYEQHKSDLAVTEEDETLVFDAHIVVEFSTCPTRPVPALADSCASRGQTTAHSRIYETIELRLVPGRAPAPAAPPYRRLRLLFGLEVPRLTGDGQVVTADQEVLDARAEISALPSEQQPVATLKAFRRLAALDGIDLAPASVDEGEPIVLTPEKEPAPLVLADIGKIRLQPKQGGGWSLTGATVDPTIRSTHVATRTIQELLCGQHHHADPPASPKPADSDAAPVAAPPAEPASPAPAKPIELPEPVPAPPAQPASPAPGKPAEPPEPVLPPPPPVISGPKIVEGSVHLRENHIFFDVDQPLARHSVSDSAISVSVFNSDGWYQLSVDVILHEDKTSVEIMLGDQSLDGCVRLVVRGTGSKPLLGKNFTLFGGDAHSGHDFSYMFNQEEE